MRYFCYKYISKGFPAHKLFSFAPEALWVIIGQTGTAVAGLFGIKLLTYLLSPGEFGKLALANTVIAFISTNFLFGPLGQGFMRFWPIARDRKEIEIFNKLLTRYGLYATGLSIGLALLLTILVLLSAGINWANLLMLSMATGIISGWLSLRLSVLTAARKRACIALLQTGTACLKPILAAILILLITASASWALIGYFAAAFAILIITQRLYSSNISKTLSVSFEQKKSTLYKNLKKDIISFSWPFMVWGIFNWLHMSTDRWLLQTFYGKEIVGAFAVVSQLAMFPLVFGSGFLTTFFYPIANQKAGDLTTYHSLISAYKILTLMTGIYIAGALILITIFLQFHNRLVLLISNINFVTLSSLLPGLATAWALFYLGQILSTFGMLANKPQVYIKPKAAAAILALSSSLFFIIKLGPVGIVWGLTAAGFVYALWCLIIAVRLYNQSVSLCGFEEVKG